MPVERSHCRTFLVLLMQQVCANVVRKVIMVYQNVVAEYCLVTLQQATESLLGSQRCYSRRVLPADLPNIASGSSRYACEH